MKIKLNVKSLTSIRLYFYIKHAIPCHSSLHQPANIHDVADGNKTKPVDTV